MARFSISSAPIDVPALAASLAERKAGGFVSFEGWVRDHNDGRRVDRLEYEVFEALALAEGERIIDEAVANFGLTSARAVHRQGALEIGDCAVWVGATAAHRDEAFRACRYIIDEIKHRLPVWKKEHYRNGSAEWVNCQHQSAPHEAQPGSHSHAHAEDGHHDHGVRRPAFDEAAFYARQIRLPEVGPEGQAKLRAASVLIVGAGGLGSPAALMLASAGVGRLGIAEFDRLEPSNLHRQILYSAADVGRPKGELAASRLRALNPFIDIRIHDGKVTAEGLGELLGDYDLVLDCTDNFATKYLLTDAAILFGKRLIQASIHRFEGQILTIDPTSEGGCLRCLWAEPPPEGLVGNCAEVGVLGAVPGLFGTMQAAEAIKLILGLSGTLERHLLIMDAFSFESRRIARRRDPDCPLCGERPTIRTLCDDSGEAPLFELDAPSLLPHRLDRYRVVDLREPDERADAPLPGAIQAPFSGFDPAEPPFDATQPVLLVCSRGRRSRIAAEQLRALGWDNVFSLKGGAGTISTQGHQAAE